MNGICEKVFRYFLKKKIMQSLKCSLRTKMTTYFHIFMSFIKNPIKADLESKQSLIGWSPSDLYYSQFTTPMVFLYFMNRKIAVKASNTACYLYYIFMNKTKQFANGLSPQEINQHYFVMKRLGDPQDRAIVVDLSSSPSKSLQIPEQQSQNKKVGKPYKTNILFNKDGCYYSPAFLSQSDHQNMGKNLKSMLHLHMLKQKNLEEKDDLFVATPAKINFKCEICKVQIDDYLKHLDQPSHKALLCQGAYYNHILDICKPFKPKTKKINKKRTQVSRGISWNQLTEEISNDKIQFQKGIISLDSQQSQKASVEYIIIE